MRACKQRSGINYGSWFSPTMWIVGTEVRSSDFKANTLPTELSWWPLLKMHILVFKGMAPPLLDSLAISMSQTRAALWDALWCERCRLLPLLSLLCCYNRRVKTTAQILKESVRDLQWATSSRLAEGSPALISSRRLFCFKSSFSGLFKQVILHST